MTSWPQTKIRVSEIENCIKLKGSIVPTGIAGLKISGWEVSTNVKCFSSQDEQIVVHFII